MPGEKQQWNTNRKTQQLCSLLRARLPILRLGSFGYQNIWGHIIILIKIIFASLYGRVRCGRLCLTNLLVFVEFIAKQFNKGERVDVLTYIV